MTTQRVTSDRSPEPRPRLPRTPWFTTLVYAWTALGPIPSYYYLRSGGVLDAPAFADSGPFDAYTDFGVLYHLLAAICAWLLIRRSPLAVRYAWGVVAYAGFGLLRILWVWTRGYEPGAILWVTAGALVVFTLLALHVTRLRRDALAPQAALDGRQRT